MRDILLDLAADFDSAYNNHKKSEVFRGLLSSPLSLFDVSYPKEEEKLKWAMKRQLHLGSISICLFSSVPGNVWTSIALTSSLDRLRQLDIDYSDDVSDALLLPPQLAEGVEV